VSVTRNNINTGYEWLVTFDGCLIKNGTDVCNEGDISLMVVDNTNMACAIQIDQVVQEAMNQLD
jgi:hypothetical protein